jgi:serine protease AprX
MAHAAEVAWHSGIVVVAAAGNDGSTTGRLADPAIDPYLIAVGAADTDLGTSPSNATVPSFSNRGDGTRNPDVIAPGVHIASLTAPGSAVDTAYGAAAGVGTRLIRGSGTSQSTAMVSGAAALLLSIHPSLTPDKVKALLTRSARAVSGAGPRDEGAGLINVYRALGTRSNYATQSFAPSTGGGTLDGSRGTHIVTLDGVPLVGEQDIFGVPFDAAAVAADEESGTAWTGGVWNGSSWAGSSWAGSSWAGSSWAGSSWAGSSWAGSSWAGSSWAGSSWAGSSWAGNIWADPTPSPTVTPAPSPSATVPIPDPTAAPSPDPSVSTDPVPVTPDPAPSADTGTTDPSAAGGTS